MGEAQHPQTTHSGTKAIHSEQMKNISISDTTMSMIIDISKRHNNKKVNLILEDLIAKLYSDMKKTGGKVL